MHEAMFWREEGGRALCELCPHHCLVAKGRSGICGVRTNVDGRLMALTYGKVSSMGLDPIEKKPFYHFKPGHTILSFGSVGCNLGCLHCQNYSISQAAPDSTFLRDIPPEKVPELVRGHGSEGVAWTYNEPTMWTEFVIDSGRICKKMGLFTGFVTNGFISESPLRELKGIVDAVNIDVKGFTEDFYRTICKARLQPVLDAVEVAKELGMHVELTYLVIPDKNDGEEEIGRFCEWAVSVDAGMPIHFSRFHPDYKMLDSPPTPVATMERAHKIAKEKGLLFAYVGNMPSDNESTYCPSCGSLVIKRTGFSIRMVGVKDGRCSKCGASLGLVL